VNNVGYTNLWGYASGQDTLASFNPETGAITAIGSFTLDGSDNQSVNSLLIANNGTLYALSHDSSYTATDDSNNGVAYVGDNSNVAIETLDLSTCGLTSVATETDYMMTLAFDQDGTLWIDNANYQLISGDVSNWKATRQLLSPTGSNFSTDANPSYQIWTEALFI